MPPNHANFGQWALSKKLRKFDHVVKVTWAPPDHGRARERRGSALGLLKKGHCKILTSLVP